MKAYSMGEEDRGVGESSGNRPEDLSSRSVEPLRSGVSDWTEEMVRWVAAGPDLASFFYCFLL